MRSLVCAVVLVVLCSGGECRQKRDVGFRCCTPKAWTSHVRLTTAGVVNGRNEYEEMWQTYHYDRDNQREAWTDVSQEGRLMYRRVIMDYKRHRRTIEIDEDLCFMYEMKEPFQPRCTPGNATLVLFAVAPLLTPLEGVFANTVYYGSGDVTGHMTVTVGQCALIEEAVYTTPTSVESDVTVFKYFNQTLTVDPSVFVIPKNVSCPLVPPGGAEDRHMKLVSKLAGLKRVL